MKKRQYIVVIIMLLVFISLFINRFYEFDFLSATDYNVDYTIHNMEKSNKIYVSGTDQQYPVILSTESTYGVSGYKFLNYQVLNLNNEDQTKVNNTFHIGNLEPQTEYNIKLSFNAKINNADSALLEITYSQNKIDYVLNSETNKYSVGLQNQETDNNYLNYYLFNDNNYYEASITGITNSSGSLYIVLAISGENLDSYDYNINSLNIDLENNGRVNDEEDNNLQNITDGQGNEFDSQE